jgi:hypothetical protein
VVRLRLLSTPSRDDAVTFDYEIRTNFDRDLHPADSHPLQTHPLAAKPPRYKNLGYTMVEPANFSFSSPETKGDSCCSKHHEDEGAWLGHGDCRTLCGLGIEFADG